MFMGPGSRLRRVRDDSMLRGAARRIVAYCHAWQGRGDATANRKEAAMAEPVEIEVFSDYV